MSPTAYCQSCGAQRDGGSAFCTRCGAPFPRESEAPPHEGSREPDRDGSPAPLTVPRTRARGWQRGSLAVLACAAVIAAVVVVPRLVQDRPAVRVDPATSPSSSGLDTSPLRSSQPSSPSSSAQDTSPGAGATTTHPTPRQPSPYLGNATVSVAPAAQLIEGSPLVVGMLTRYFHDINTRNFTDYLGLFSSDIRAHTDPQQLASGYRSTYDTDAELLALHRSADGRPMAVLAFTSHQDAQDGPNGLTCARWLIHLYLEPGPGAGGYVFGTAPPSYHARFSSC